jgi:chromatin remodeling complex protein RSC6
MVLPLVLHKAWKWLKHYWWIPAALIIGLILLWIYRPAGQKLIDMIGRQQQRHREEIDALEKIHEEEKRQKAEAQAEHDRRIEEIKEEHRKTIEELDEKEKERAEDLLRRHDDDPEELSRRLADLLGSRHIP